jgi:hypothetical protein
VHEAGSCRADDGTLSDSAAAGAGSTLDSELSEKPGDENACMPRRKAIKELERENGRAKKLCAKFDQRAWQVIQKKSK